MKMTIFSRQLTCSVAGALVVICPLAAPLPAPAQSWIPEGGATVRTSEDGERYIVLPEDDVGAKALEARRKAQLEAARSYAVYHDFGFTEVTAQTGIEFRHVAVDDAAKHLKPAHYDHGNGLLVADVDGDGHFDLYFLNQVGTNALYRNRGDGTFENITKRAGVGLEDRISVTGAFADIDNDGDPDLFISTVRMGNVLFENDGKGSFTDISRVAGVGHVGHSSGAVFFDYNRDRLLDLFVTNVGVYTFDLRGGSGNYIARADAFRGHLDPRRGERSILYENQGNRRFRDASDARSLRDVSWSGDATFTDFDGDLWPDLYVLNMQGDDHYYRNQAGRSFVEATDEHFPKTPWGAMGVKFFDYDNNGRLDLFLTDMHSDMTYLQSPEEETKKSNMNPSDAGLQGGQNNIFGNAFYENQGDGRFAEVSDEIGVENYWPWGFSAEDLNADGWQDLLITSSMNYPFRYGINSLLLNDRGERFLPAELVLGVEPRSDGRTKTPYFKLDCDGEDDGHRLCEGIEGEVTVMANLGSRTSVFLDYDEDGDLDLILGEFNSPALVLRSDLAQQKDIRWLSVELTGTRSNRDGLGARVAVSAGGKVLTRVHDGKSGYLSQSSKPLYFGLGDAKKVDKIEVTWPSGEVQTLSDVEPNQQIEITEPAAEDEEDETEGQAAK